MSAAWTSVAIVGVGTVLLKAAGPAILGGRSLPARLDGVVALLAPALLAALVVDQAFASGRHLVLDGRAAGVAAAAVAIVLRAPLLLVIVIAAVATALVRLV
ncbi:MAG TPA: AzlD domain-containing protein [Gaiellaceae bacterium]|nr:AzlD domain-containing protein [Gaiellaceae bacterium]